jgi:hypothetical protein
MSFLTAYRAYIEKATDASIEFCEASALMALSTIALGWRWIERGPGIRPNLYMMLIAHSSADRKSTCVEFCCDMIEDVAPQRMGPEDWTPEGLVSMLRKRPGAKTLNRLVLPMPEFGEHLARMRKQYGSDMNAVLCKVYDGKSFKRARSGKKMIEIKKPRVGLFGGVAYAMIEKHGDAADWDTGLYARILWITPRNRRPRFSTAPPTPKIEKQIATDELSRLYDTLQNTKGPIGVDPGADAVYSSFAASIPEDQPTTAHSAQRERLLNSVWKLAIVYQIDIDPMADIGALAMERACTFASHAWDGFKIAFSVCSDSDLDRLMTRLWKRVTEAGEIQKRDLQRRTHASLSQFGPAMEMLCKLGYVKVHAAAGGKNGYKVVHPYEPPA